MISVAWVLGIMRSELSIIPYIKRSVPQADHVTKVADGLFHAWEDKVEKNLLGYVVVGQADGYGGPLTLSVAVNDSGKIIKAVIVDHKETPAWMSRVLKSNLLNSMVGKLSTEPLEIGSDLDGVTGATVTSKAIAEAAVKSCQEANRHLGLPVKINTSPKIIFGIPEIVLLLLFMLEYLNHSTKSKYRWQARWISMLIGMVVLGFIYNRPLTLVHISKLLIGYWPQWQTDLYWYFLLCGIFIIFIINNRNSYCEWFCPFGAAQECMGLVGGIKLKRPRRTHNTLRNLQRTLALVAVLLGLYLRNPGLSNYELYGTLFGLVGTSIQFAALGLILIAAMFIRRPWCNYLCPVKPILEFIRIFRGWGKEIWKGTIENSKIS